MENRNKRRRHNRLVKQCPDHKYNPTKKIDYWRIFEVNNGCLLLQCSIHSNGGSDHLVILNFSGKYIYDNGNNFLTIPIGKPLGKLQAMNIFSNFNIAHIKRVWLIARHIKIEGVPTKSIYGNLKLGWDWICLILNNFYLTLMDNVKWTFLILYTADSALIYHYFSWENQKHYLNKIKKPSSTIILS